MSLDGSTPMTVSGTGVVIGIDYYTNKVTVKLACVRRRKQVKNIDEFTIDFYSTAADTIKDQVELNDCLWVLGELRGSGLKTRIKAIHFDILKEENEDITD